VYTTAKSPKVTGYSRIAKHPARYEKAEITMDVES